MNLHPPEKTLDSRVPGISRLVQRSSLLLLASAAFAQNPATPAQEETDKKNGDAPVMLSPFTVDSSKDEGYRATNTLAGTRINTSLRDVASPISVITKDFINDIGATNVNDILAFQVGSEGTRDFTTTTGQLGRTTDGPGQDPSASTRGRGLSSYDVTRNYFFSLTAGQFTSLGAGTSVGFDPYNLEDVTVSRGPNSVLAGLGSPAGIINYAPALAQVSKNSGEASYRIGSYGDQRATVNVNRVVAPGVFALRAAAAVSDRRFKQEPAFAHDRRAYVTGTWRPWKKTSIQASYEWVRVNQRLPNTLTPEDDVTQWIEQGKPTIGKGDPANPLLSGGIGGGGPTVFFNSDGSISGAYNAASQFSFFQRNRSNVGIWQPQRFANNKYGDWDELNTSASNTTNKLKTTNISIDQEILPNLAVNVAYVYESLDSTQINLFRPDYVAYQVDVNRTLPNGAANPHLGETYMYFRGLDNSQKPTATNQAGRITATYSLDLNKYNPWFGRYSIVGFAERRTTSSDFIQFNAMNGAGAETSRVFYLGGTAANGYRAQSVPRTPFLISGQKFLNDDGTTGTFADNYVLKSDSKALTRLSTTAIVFQGYLFGDRVVPLLGIRRDVDHAGFSNAAGAIAPEIGTLDKISAQTKSYGVVVHPVKSVSLYYNRSENFIPNAGSVDLLGNPTSNPVGKSKDYGVSVDLFNNKLSAKIGWYETNANHGAAPTVNFPLVQWTLPFVETGYPTGPGVLGAFQELAQKAGITYKPGIASGLTTGDSKLANAYTADTVAKGVEFELTYNVTKNWRIFGTVTKQEAKQTNIASDLTGFINERLKYWQATPGLWTGQTTTKGWNGVPETGQQVFNNYVLGDFIRYQSADGQPSTQLHKWRGSLVTNYTLSQESLKGFSVGGGLRYQDGGIIGNPAIYNSAGAVVGLDLQHPYKSGSTISADVWVGYRKRISSQYVLSFQLRCQDLQSSGGYKPIVSNSDGTHSVYSIEQPRSFYLTSKLEF